MDRSYILDSYINENEENLAKKNNARELFDNLEFRIKGSKTLEELKKEVSIFFTQNNLPSEVKDEMDHIISEFTDETDVYTASTRLENVLSNYLDSKESEFTKSNDTVYEIKEEVVNNVIKDLDSVGITTVGDNDDMIEKIESEEDVIKLKENVETTVEYFESRNEIIGEENSVNIEISTADINESLDRPGTDTVLETALEEQETSLDTNVTNVEALEDGSVVIHGDSENEESLNFTAMMTVALVANNPNFEINEQLDMKLIKGNADTATYKAIYGKFPLTNHPENRLDPVIVDRIQRMAQNYNPNFSYMELLSTTSPELSIALNLINNHILNEQGAFQMAIKNGGMHHEMVFAMDENYISVSDSFRESGAMVSSDMMENNIVRVNNTTEGEQLMILNATLENLKQKKIDKAQSELLQNVYQKKKVYEQPLNESANTFNIFLMTIVGFEIIILLIGFIFMFR